MACAKCGEVGHNARTCPYSAIIDQKVGEPEDYVVWQRFGGMTKAQAKEFRRRSEDLLDEIAPNAVGVSAAARASELPERIRQAIEASKRDQPKQLSEGRSNDSLDGAQESSENGKNSR